MKENNIIREFESREFGRVRTTTSANGAPLVCGIDLTRALGYSKGTHDIITKMVDRIDIIPIKVGGLNVNFITETGVNTLFSKTRKDKAEGVGEWLESHVIPVVKGDEPKAIKGPDAEVLRMIAVDIRNIQNRFLGETSKSEFAGDMADSFVEKVSEMAEIIGHFIGRTVIDEVFA